MASSKGDAAGTYNLALLYFDGKGVPKDQARTLELFLDAAALGHPSATYNVAAMYENGLGTEKNIEEAVKWYGKSAEMGNETAMQKVAEYKNSGGTIAASGETTAGTTEETAGETTTQSTTGATEETTAQSTTGTTEEIAAQSVTGTTAQNTAAVSSDPGTEIEALREDLAKREADFQIRSEALKARESELEARYVTLGRREAELDARSEALKLGEAEFETQKAELANREAELNAKSDDLGKREAKLAEGTARLEATAKKPAAAQTATTSESSNASSASSSTTTTTAAPKPAKSAYSKSFVPEAKENETVSYGTIEPAPKGGVKITTEKGRYATRLWTVDPGSNASLNRWEFEGTIERSDLGGSGIMFGDKGDFFLAFYVHDDRITAARYKDGAVTVLSEIMLKAKHRKPGRVTMKVTADRKSNAIKCTVDGISYPFRFAAAPEIPLIKQYGFFGGSNKAKNPTTSIYRRFNARGGN
jgi:hypothetical protein